MLATKTNNIGDFLGFHILFRRSTTGHNERERSEAYAVAREIVKIQSATSGFSVY